MSTGTNIPRPSSKKDEEKIDQLLREGIAAAKIGDKATARTRLQEVVELDQYNEKGWYWLASVVETVEERRACLGNVVVINPDNKRAHELLDQIDNPGVRGRKAASISADTIEGRPNRRLLIVGGVVGAIVLLFVIVAVLLGGNKPPVPTVVVMGETPTSEVTGTAATTDGTPSQNPALAGTGAATAAATQTESSTATPTASPSPVRVGTQTGTPLALPPAGLPGRLIILSGSTTVLRSRPNTPDNWMMPMFIIEPDGKNQKPFAPNDRGNFAILTPDGQRIIYSLYNYSTDSQQMRVSTVSGQSSELSVLWNNQPPLNSQQMPSVSRNGQVMVFSALNTAIGARGDNDKMAAIYALLVKFSTQPNEPTATQTKVPTVTPQNTRPATLSVVPTRAAAATTRPATQAATPKIARVTAKDSGSNTWPAVSPDGKSVVYVRDASPLAEEGIDLYVIPTQGGEPQQLTNDGTEIIEAAPEWSPDGKQIAYHSGAKDSKTNEIYVMDASGKNVKKLVESGADNIRPHWSPDGKYIAFSSTRTGKWEVFIVEVATGKLFQVTRTQPNTLCTAWGP